MSRFRLAQLASLLAYGAVTMSAPPVRAQNPAAAEALFEQARAAMAAGSYDIACARFRDSDRLDPAVGTRFNLADCEERRGRVATAWSLFRGVLSELALDDDRRPIAEERAKALEPRLPMLTLTRTSETPRAIRVRMDGAEIGEGSFGVPLPMDPGSHQLTLQDPEGGAPQHTAFVLKEGQHSRLPLQLRAPTPAGEEDDEFAAARSGSRQRWGYLAGGVGIGGVAFGTVAGIVTLNKKSTADANCDDHAETCNAAGVAANESGKTYAALSGIGFGVGVVGLAVGAYLLLTSPAPVRGSARGLPPVVTLLPQLEFQQRQGFVGVAGRF